MRLRGLQKGGWLEVRKSIILKVMLSLVPEESNSSRCFPNTVTKRVFFSCIILQWISLCDGFCHLLSVVSQKWDYRLLSEMKQMVVCWRDLSWASNVMGRWVPRVVHTGAVWDRGRKWSAERCDWRHSFWWSTMCVWQSALLSLRCFVY